MQTNLCRTHRSWVILPAALFSLCSLPALADSPALLTAAAPGSAAAALDALVGKPQIVGFTEKNGTKFLGRVLSGDHTHYTVQAFHFTGPSQTTTRAYDSGRSRRTARIQTPTYIPDVEAVEYLLAGAAGSQTHPREMPTGSGILAASDIKYLQALSPPVKPAKSKSGGAKLAAAAPTPAKTTTSASAAPAASPWAWTLTTLWPTAEVKAKSKN